ncbi:helix-turn-helix domain-containing protein [mine drainage metagenome]|uniref:Helix-turn-helix domain-containing protein n=1 Tax=mine drainage metagenome TaxID=410659 RepID=T1AA56_9ZZZZ
MNGQTLAPIIRTARHTRQLSQQSLADRVGLSRKSIGEFESGRHTELGLGRFLVLCDALGLELTLLPKDRALADKLAALRMSGQGPRALGKFELRKRERDLDLRELRNRARR